MSNFAFTKINYILLAIGMAIVIVGFILMAGEGSHEGVFNADIFSARRSQSGRIHLHHGSHYVQVKSRKKGY